MPPSRLMASPMEETVTSRRVPGGQTAGRLAVTKTAATFLTTRVVGETCTPMRCSILAKVWVVKMVCWRSPVPFRSDHHAIAEHGIFAHPFNAGDIAD